MAFFEQRAQICNSFDFECGYNNHESYDEGFYQNERESFLDYPRDDFQERDPFYGYPSSDILDPINFNPICTQIYEINEVINRAIIDESFRNPEDEDYIYKKPETKTIEEEKVSLPMEEEKGSLPMEEEESLQVEVSEHSEEVEEKSEIKDNDEEESLSKEGSFKVENSEEEAVEVILNERVLERWDKKYNLFTKPKTNATFMNALNRIPKFKKYIRRLEGKSKRRQRADLIQLKIKRDFNKQMFNKLNSRLKAAKVGQIFKRLNNDFISDPSIKTNTSVTCLTLIELYQKNFSKKNIEDENLIWNRNLIKSLLEHPNKVLKFDLLGYLTYGELFQEYLHSAEFRNSIIKVQSKQEPEYVAKYLYYAFNFFKE
ncbi:MAG: hypothetical protein MJ252_02775 [archaeon]|nr:hypothetical protein [archaeon]